MRLCQFFSFAPNPRRNPVSWSGRFIKVVPGSSCFPIWRRQERSRHQFVNEETLVTRVVVGEWHARVGSWQRSKWSPIWDAFHPRSPLSCGSDKLSHKLIQMISPKNFICGARKQNLPGACFSKVPVTFRARKEVLYLLCLHSAKQSKVSIILRIMKWTISWRSKIDWFVG